MTFLRCQECRRIVWPWQQCLWYGPSDVILLHLPGDMLTHRKCVRQIIFKGRDVKEDPEYLIDYNACGRNLVMNCSVHGKFYDEPKAKEWTHDVWEQAKKHKEEVHGKEVR